ncbi:hypothetical protein CgunFtcFv8_001196 [Champsocephalus gunnari]|uniref:Uncharacterized protein n=1 Tax=Champsocephalus gunnari TaxID=52237 RepID=A0AAN8HPW5_CHAGU|nr:hypothetical protein CgunFtcFv8_001196 [Champsocephalus gunnari]
MSSLFPLTCDRMETDPGWLSRDAGISVATPPGFPGDEGALFHDIIAIVHLRTPSPPNSITSELHHLRNQSVFWRHFLRAVAT